MATILLQAAGSLVGGVLGGPFGAVLGRAAGALAGASVDSWLFGGTTRSEGPRLTGSRIMQADEGAGIPRVYGSARVAGQVIWTTRFEEDSDTERQGGKGGPRVEVTTYSYYGNVAVGLCEGPIAAIRRVWADGEELDLSDIVYRVYRGDEGQAPDPLIEARQGAGNAPAYRGLAYLVFERLPLERWGNRIPQISCEVLRPVGRLESQIRAVTIIPGASEHGLDPRPVRERLGPGEDRLVNRNMLYKASDWTASLDELGALCPALGRAALVVSWFGDDLRAGHCTLRPGVELSARDEDETWRAGGVGRGGARLISRLGGGPAFGGTPSDAGVLRAIADLKARGLAVTYYPFILMDVPQGNALPDPYGGAAQAAFPWRGRMTLDIAPGRPGSPDGTAAARTAVDAFLGTADPSDFSVGAGGIGYSGPAEWSYRRMIFHQAHLAKLAGVDAFVIGSEMRGLTQIRDGDGRFPFVEGLIDIAEAVKAMMPEAIVTYAADWSEYSGHQPADGSGDVFYHLDPLWASPAIDVVGIDNYLPLADRRDGATAEDGAPSDYDVPALRAGIAGGEYFDWYYAGDADRAAGLRTPITDGAAGKPWVFRPKDIASWWANPHVERRGGVEVAGPSPWVPMSKPIWFTELGCPAIHRGPNQPNVFVDPKSSESFVPHFSAGGRDDLVQRRFLEAQLGYWDPASPDFTAANNPVSPLYGGRMVDPGAIHLWTWDARPYPAFPGRTDVWSDGDNWRRGHWLSGRLANAPVDALIAAMLEDHGIGDYDVSAVEASIGGFVVSGPDTARRALEELMRLTGTVAHVSGGGLVFRSLARVSPVSDIGAFVDDEGAYVERRRGEAGEAAEEIALGFLDPARAYQPASAEAVRAEAAHPRKAVVDLPVVLEEDQARELAAAMLQEAGVIAETARLAVAPSMLGLETGDVVTLAERPGDWLVTRIETGAARRIEARRLPPRRRARPDQGAPGPTPQPGRPGLASRPVVHLLDLPLPDGGEGIAGARFAVVAKPWVPCVITAAGTDGAPERRATASRPATAGILTRALAARPVGIVDRANRPRVRLYRGALASISHAAMLDGGNLCAVEAAPGLWEVLQFEIAEEVAPFEFELAGLLRGQGGTEDAMAAGAAAGAAFVLLDAGAGALGLTSRDVGRSLAWRVAPLGRPLDDPAVVSVTAALGHRSVKPLSPVHLAGTYAADGSLTATWIRRTRIGGDGWDGIEVPLGEERELYRIEITDAAGGLLVRETDGPALAVPAGELAAAFGALPAALTLRVAQVSPQWGAGTARSAVIGRAV
ncbi:glycoside hydrolase TIM-barrel-like domain-containing protein [Aurantimonas sp. HBX-1]|uniref:baseplate multidomain protein megatron n=1 Tax=Aurantimonas sp. HBX-1 TaxID=2906072 RepID=UPI001F4157DB|nr:glycoside hydrolase TIM-barrel-like domain-containing protein [Aurantimonas sp. HBX-1]UIJ70628.1 glycoside hydrolase TIM-barrel-like domain-containing protein [Aurantimonas sp. HBX-1]